MHRSTIELRRTGTGRVRNARTEDLPQIRRLLSVYGVTDPGWLARGHVLVLDDGGTIDAAAFLDEQGLAPRLALLVIDPARSVPGVEDRMIGVADALCEALRAA